MNFTSIHSNSSSITLSTLPSSSSSSSSSQSYNNYNISHYPKPSNLSLPRVPFSRSVLCLARRRSNSGRPVSSSKKNKSPKKEDSNKDDAIDEDGFEALFKQLEEDLKQDEEFLDSEDEISEEELAMLERELEEALAEDENMSALLSVMTNDAAEGESAKEEMEEEVEVGEDNAGDDEEEDDDEEEEPVQLKGWQLRRLAQALKVGRRKTSIKNLAAELCLDRAVVLELLREPPPNLLMMSASLPDKPKPVVTVPDSEDMPSVPSEVIADSEVIAHSEKPEPKVETPIHVLQGSWSARKRLKKVQVETLENVYRRTKRPTNTMISSIAHVTNLPRRRILKWFEDKRADEGVPADPASAHQRPYRRSSSESVFTQ